MLTALLALLLFVGCASGIYLLLKNMGEDGVEVAAPGSCKSGQCGVKRGAGGGCSSSAPEEPIEFEEIRREPMASNERAVH